MSPAVFEPTIPGDEQPQTHALDRAATGTGSNAASSTNQMSSRSVFRYEAICLSHLVANHNTDRK